MPQSKYSLDYETTSKCDIGLGAYRYAEDESTRILMFAIAKDNGEPLLWTFNDPHSDEALAAEAMFAEAVASGSLVHAFNVQFELAVSHYRLVKDLGITPPLIDNWRCTQARCRRAAAPASLAAAAEFFQIEQQKNDIGKALIGIFSDQNKSVTLSPPPGFMDPASMRQLKNGAWKGKRPKRWTTFNPILDEEVKWDWLMNVKGKTMSVRKAWDAFCKYCKQDVRVERALNEKLKHFELKGQILEAFQFDMRMNFRGVPVNVSALANANAIVDGLKEKLSARFRAMTGLNYGQRAAVKMWMERRGYDGGDMQAGTVDKVLANPPAGMSPLALEALRVRSMISFAALAKLPTMRDAACTDGRVRGTTQWHAARTGRAGGRIIQPQNFKKSSIETEKKPLIGSRLCYDLICKNWEALWYEELWNSPLEAIASAIRHFIQPVEGGFFDGDFAGVEARITPWLVGDIAKLKIILDGVDLYKRVAAMTFNVTYDEVTKLQRTIAKPIELGCCIAEDELVLTHRGLVPIQNVLLDDSVWDGVEWVSHEGVIYQGVRDVISYQGLSATPDHEVFVKGGGDQKIPLAQVISRKLNLRTCGPQVQEGPTHGLKASRVYDLLNAGPRHRFTVSGKLVSNCFGVGAKTLKSSLADIHSVERTLEECQGYVKTYRANHPETVQAWADIEEAAKRAIAAPGKVFTACDGKLTFSVGRAAGTSYLVIKLPSGRGLYYPQPQVKTIFKKYTKEDMELSEWKREKGGYEIEQISFYGKIPMTENWGRIGTWGSRLLENCLTADTEVLTEKGWRPIQKVGTSKVYDGLHFVDHDGLRESESDQVIRLNRLGITRDHLILTPEGWVKAEEVDIERAYTQASGVRRRGNEEVVKGAVKDYPATEKQPVFDLLNCGPRNRFVVRAPGGRPLIVHNCVQAIGVDLLNRGMVELERNGYPVCMIIHDQGLCETAASHANASAEEFKKLMCTKDAWAETFPLDASVDVFPYYLKD